MKSYETTSSFSYLTTNNIVKDAGQHSVSPTEIKAFVITNGIVLSNDANDFTISIDTNTYYNQTQITNLLASKQDAIAAGTYYSQTEIDNLLIVKQDLIADGDLTIAKTQGLQGELNLLTQNVGSKVDSILFTNVTNGLSLTLNAKREIAGSYIKTEVDSFFTN